MGDKQEIIDELIKTGVRAGYATRTDTGIKASASDGHLWFLGDLANRLFEQMEGKDGYLVFIPKNTHPVGGKG